jgi:uncharacterized membrane protein YphA (DoxX/SURF4 family)
LFSTFPRGWPGTGLLLLRVAAGIPPILDAAAGVSSYEPVLLQWLALVAGASLLVGWWTPITGALLAIAEISIALAGPTFAQSHLILAGLGAGLAMAGPGAWSLDALRFGPRRIDIPDRHSPERGAPRHHD